ncbi:glycosyltransferase [Streptomyces sp. NPDC007901]|uniref:glycosyltransferase family protein n=1 Tax=Streptomyces sp. NPDC007901 TaxID=3364785 RepID=UPI0036EBDDE2
MMGPGFGRLYTAALAGDVVPYCWDVWQPQWELWTRHLRRLRPPAVFVAAEQSALFLARALPDTRVVHLPEATRLSLHDPSRPLAARSIGVLELGRRHQKWHDAVRDAVTARSTRRHLYEQRIGDVVFPREADLYRGFSNTVISVCFPRSLTHPGVAGEVETTTQRYFESMASGCLVLGHAPAELVRLMGYNPVVEVDWTAPAEQVLDILAAPHRWQPHVDEALRRVREVGDWSVRVRALRATVESAVTARRPR